MAGKRGTAAQTPQAPNNKEGDGGKAGEDNKSTGGKKGDETGDTTVIKYVCKGGIKKCGLEIGPDDNNIMCDW